MSVLVNLIRNLSTLNLLAMVERILQRHEPELLELQKDQLYAGLDSRGQLLKPSYSQDPYFKNPGAGSRYAAWKQSRTPRADSSLFPTKPTDTPNLIITGTLFYHRLFVEVGGGNLMIDANSPIMAKLDSKYGNLLLGLNDIARTYVATEFLFIELQDMVYKHLK